MTPYSFLLGWRLVRPTAHEWLQPDLPGAIISGSRCLCDVRPNDNDWYDSERSAFLQEHSCNFEYAYSFFRDLESALSMKERWLGAEYLPLAVALQPLWARRLDVWMHELQASSNAHNPNFSYTPLEAQSLTGRERLLGYDVLGYNWGWESFLCSGLQKELGEIFSGTLTPQGLITDGAIAEKFALYINEEDAGEPGLYLSCAVYAPE